MEFVDQEFVNQQIRLDFNRFIRCRFINCSMIFSGFGGFGIEQCELVEASWTLADAARTTVQMLTGIYHGAGETGPDLVEQIFDSIRQNALPIEAS
jgi:hypothetical protein